MSLDIKLFFLLNSFAGRSPVFDALVIFFADYLGYLLVAAFLFFVYFVHRGQGEKRDMLWVAVLSTVAARGVLTPVVRYFWHRPRPFALWQVYQLVPESGYSFPSGHAIFFFALGAALYLYNKKWGVWFFAVSFLMGIARIIAGVHYPSDILGGMVLGVITAYAVCAFYNRTAWVNSQKILFGNPRMKKILGVVFIIIGLTALVTPFTPGSWLIFVGLESLGLRLAVWDKIRAYFKKTEIF